MLFNIQHAFGLDDAQLGVLLAVAIAVAGASSAVMAHSPTGSGHGGCCGSPSSPGPCMLCVLALMHEKWAFALALVLTEVAGGSHRHRHERRGLAPARRPPFVLVRLHALFNAGALTGAAVAALVIHAGVSWRWVWPGIAVVALAVGVWAPPPIRAAGEPIGGGARDRVRHTPLRRLRRDGLLVLLAVFALAEMTEGGVDTWGVLYLRNHLATGVLLGAGAYVVGQAVAATTRGAGGPVLGRLSAAGRRSSSVGASPGAGILLESLTSLSGLAAVGLALGAGGASLFWPLVMSTVSRQASQVVSAVGAFTAAGYIGWVAGAPIVGWVSQNVGPARGLQVLAVAAFGVAVCTLVQPSRRPSAAAGANG